MKNSLVIASILAPIVLIGISLVYTRGINNTSSLYNSLSSSDIRNDNEASPQIGPPGSDHAHISLVISIDDSLVDLSQPRYMLKNRLVHFENNDGITVHKHATGVTVPYFLNTLGIRIDKNCLTLDTGESYCSDTSKKLRVLLNGKQINILDLYAYEMKDRDRILIDYSDDNDADLQLKFNAVPQIPNVFQ